LRAVPAGEGGRVMPVDRLWAKSNPPIGLLDHLKDVRDAGAAAFEAVGSDVIRALAPGGADGLRRLLEIACWMHDLLKANTAFQDMLDDRKPVKQPIRHETLAAVLMATDGPLRDWLAAVVPDRADRWAVVWAVAGHHLQMADPARNPAVPLVRDYPDRFTALLGASDVRAALGKVSDSVTVPSLVELVYDTADEDEPGCLRDRAGEYVRNSAAAWRRLKRDPKVRMLSRPPAPTNTKQWMP
jgi:CRISPR-associated endonuclease Cas3-HD